MHDCSVLLQEKVEMFSDPKYISVIGRITDKEKGS